MGVWHTSYLDTARCSYRRMEILDVVGARALPCKSDPPPSRGKIPARYRQISARDGGGSRTALDRLGRDVLFQPLVPRAGASVLFAGNSLFRRRSALLCVDTEKLADDSRRGVLCTVSRNRTYRSGRLCIEVPLRPG